MWVRSSGFGVIAVTTVCWLDTGDIGLLEQFNSRLYGEQWQRMVYRGTYKPQINQGKQWIWMPSEQHINKRKTDHTLTWIMNEIALKPSHTLSSYVLGCIQHLRLHAIFLLTTAHIILMGDQLHTNILWSYLLNKHFKPTEIASKTNQLDILLYILHHYTIATILSNGLTHINS